MNNKKLKRIIGILIIIVIIAIISILVALFIINSSKNSKSTSENTINNEEQLEEDNAEDIGDPPVYENYKSSNTLTNVSDIDEYFIVKNILYSYFYNCKQLNINETNIEIPRDELTEEEKAEYIKTEVANTQKISKDAIYSMLADKYISEYGITKENVKDKFKITYSYKTIIQNIYFVNTASDVYSYLVSGINIDATNNKNIEFTIMITTDKTNNTFIIWPEEYIKKHNYNSLKVGDKLETSIESIENKNYNTFEYETIDKSEIAEEYFNNYKYSMMYKLSDTYEKLDEEYAKKRFGSKKVFSEYIDENYETLISAYISQYKETSNTNYVEYKCLDNYNNAYIFRVYNGVTEYKVLLDDYTIMKSATIYQYGQMNKASKAKYHLENLIKKVNTKDYNAIYDNLNSTFKNENFKNVSDLKKYVKNNFYNLNSIDIKESDSETYDYCVFKCTLTNMQNTDESKELTVIINIKDGTDFDMSFSFN